MAIGPSTGVPAAISGAVGQSFVDGLHLALITAAIVLVAGAVVVWRRMRPDEGPRQTGAAEGAGARQRVM